MWCPATPQQKCNMSDVLWLWTSAGALLPCRALQELQVANAERFSKVQQAAKEQTVGSRESDLRRLRRQFSSLKNTFLHYDVKQTFIDGACLPLLHL